MSVSASLYHTLCRELAATCPTIRHSSRVRLALLITAMIAGESCVIARLARRVRSLGLSSASAASIARRLRRTMNDPRLTAAACYGPVLRSVLARAIPRGGTTPLLVAIDESTLKDRVHLLRAALVYRGSTLPLAWVTWTQNRKRSSGAYGQSLDALLAAVADRLPPDVPVAIMADRAYAVPSVTDRISAHGWHWIVRVTTTGKHRWRSRGGAPASPTWGPDRALAEVIADALPQAGTRVRMSGCFAKKAGWRPTNLIGVWAVGQAEPLVVLTDLPPRWLTLAWYGRRFWIEPGFRGDKSAGWHWEQSQVRDPNHQQVLLLALAWGTLLSLWLGAEAAAHRLVATVTSRQRPTHARLSLATLGREELIGWIYGTRQGGRRRRIPWALPNLFGPAWTMEWSATLARHFIFAQPVRP